MWRRNKNTYVWMIVNWLAILPVRVRPGIDDVNFIWSHMSLTFWGLLIKCLFLSSFFLLWTSWNISYFYIFLVWTLPKFAQRAEPIGIPRSARRYPQKKKTKHILMCKWLSNLLLWAQFIAYIFFFPFIHKIPTRKFLMYLKGSLEMGKSNTYGIATSCRIVTSFFNTWLFALFFPFKRWWLNRYPTRILLRLWKQSQLKLRFKNLLQVKLER